VIHPVNLQPPGGGGGFGLIFPLKNNSPGDAGITPFPKFTPSQLPK
jgi:hypothetical protein